MHGATLLDAADDPLHVPIRFNANLSIASEVFFDPGNCENLKNDDDVQAALEKLASLTALYYRGGDGQEAPPGQPLGQPLKVAVMSKCGPVKDAKVTFTTSGNGKLAEDTAGLGAAANHFEFTTGADGLAHCAWSLDPDISAHSQTCIAKLGTAAGRPIEQPAFVEFSANHSVASQVAYDPDKCATLKTAGADTVQVCLSKGLGAPFGSLVVGSKDTIIRAPVTQAVIYGWYDNEMGSYVNMLADRTVSIAEMM